MNLNYKVKTSTLVVILVICAAAGTYAVSGRPLKTKLNEMVSVETLTAAAASKGPVVQPYVYFKPLPPKPYPYYVPAPKPTKPPKPQPYTYPGFSNNKTNGNKITILPLNNKSNTGNAQNLGKKLAGRLLLQVENNGAMWYVDKKEYKKHQITWDNALSVFAQYAIGINNKDIVRIKTDITGISSLVDSDSDGYTDVVEIANNYDPYSAKKNKISISPTLSTRLVNSFLLQTELGGALWYVDPNGVKHLVTELTLKNIFNKYAVGISNQDLASIAGE